MEGGNKGLGGREQLQWQSSCTSLHWYLLGCRGWSNGLLSPPEASREAARDSSRRLLFPSVNGKDCVEALLPATDPSAPQDVPPKQHLEQCCRSWLLLGRGHGGC